MAGLTKAKLAKSGFKYSVDLRGHYGCVNAINWSKKDGSLLCSGGDDKRVLLWRLFGALEGSENKPVAEYIGHHSNIFCTVFDNDNTHVISCANDAKVLCYDVETCTGRKGETRILCINDNQENISLLLSTTQTLCIGWQYPLFNLQTFFLPGVQLFPQFIKLAVRMVV